MLVNIFLLIFVVGAKRRTKYPYVAAAGFGAIKAAIYYAFTHSVAVALAAGVIFWGLAAAFLFLLKRLDRRETQERPDLPVYSTAGTETMKLRWEHIPLVVLVILIIAGEMIWMLMSPRIG